jgi:integrase
LSNEKLKIDIKVKTQVYFEDEKERLLVALDEKLNENPDNTNPLAVKLLFQIGTRVGELVATMWDYIEDDSIHIQRMEANESEIEVGKKEISFTKPHIKMT